MYYLNVPEAIFTKLSLAFLTELISYLNILFPVSYNSSIYSIFGGINFYTTS